MINTTNSAITTFQANGGNFFLIGFMGSGKTHWGKKWAAVNQLAFIDLDEAIEQAAGKTIAEIFETDGEGYFRELEAQALRNCILLTNTIIACGGGAPLFFDNMQWMNEHGTTIYITCTTDEILERLLPEQAKRPLLKKLNKTELRNFIEQKVQEREPVYKQAKRTVLSGLLHEHSFTEIATSTS